METLYRRNNYGYPYFWKAVLDKLGDNFVIRATYGMVGGKSIESVYKTTQKDPVNELNSRYKAKRDAGYLSIDEIRDDSEGKPPVEDGVSSDVLYKYLNTYLPYNLNNNNTNAILPMLAKTYTGNYWKKNPTAIYQWKINGVRCLMTFGLGTDIFHKYRIDFQSREGKWWTSLNDLEEYLLSVIPEKIIQRLVEENIVLDGELYLPGYNINDINHFVKDSTCPQNKRIQFWLYDLAIDDVNNTYRDIMRYNMFKQFMIKCNNRYDHFNNTQRLVYVPSFINANPDDSIKYRDTFIGKGFEGLILRNPNMLYQFGRRRVGYMEKFKSSTDGEFEIIDAQLDKRGLPVFTCRNDVNDATFECRLGGTFEYQKEFYSKGQYIGRKLFITFGERSGIDKVPFHIRKVELIPN